MENLITRLKATFRNSYFNHLIISILVLIIILLLLKTSANQKINTENQIQLIKNGEIIATQQQNILSLKDAVEAGLVEKEKYMKDIQVQTKVVTLTKVKEVLVPYQEIIERIVYVDTSYDGADSQFVYLKVPIPIKYKDTWNYFYGRVLEEGFMIDSFGSKNNLRVTIGHKKQGFLKKAKPVVEVKSDNPQTDIKIESNAVIEEPTPFYKKVWFGIIAGAAGMFLLL